MKFVILLSVLLINFVGASAQPAAPASDSQKGYLLGPGDMIEGKVLGEPQFDFVASVDEDGKIEVPFSDQPVVAKCRTERELRLEVDKLLRVYLKNPQLSFRVTERKSRPPATIYGEVNKPQQFELRRTARLYELLAFAEGTTAEASGMVQVFRTRPPMCGEIPDDELWKSTSGDPNDVPSRLYSLSSIRLAAGESNPVIYPGDLIVVLKAQPIYITGEVVSPQGIYIKEGGTTLTEAIAKVGGVRQGAKTKDIKIYRFKPNSKDKEVVAANLEEIKKGTQKDIMLEPYDIVEVDRAKEGIAKSILSMALGLGKTVVTSGANSIGYRVIY